MKKALVFIFAAALATSAFAQGNSDDEIQHGNGHGKVNNEAGKAASSGNVLYHAGGKVIRNAHVVLIFWGTFPSGYTSAMQSFRNQFGTTGEYNTITQYTGIDDANGSTGAIALSNLAGGPPDYFDPSTPPTNVTDALVIAEVKKAIAAQGSTDYNAVYEVFIPSGSYSSDGSSTSCGGPNLAYCAYHWYYTDTAGKHVKYSIEPWPGCSGCSVSGWTSAQNQEHFVCHETREAVTDPLGNAWFDRRGAEADDKCAWTPAPFIGTGGYGYQYEWSNANGGCVKTR